jgi:hypothetical protein
MPGWQRREHCVRAVVRLGGKLKQASAFVLGSVVYLFAGSGAAQSYAEGRLTCGETVLDLRAVSEASASPSEIKVRDLTRLLALADEAWNICLGDNSVMGCKQLNDLLVQRKADILKAWASGASSTLTFPLRSALIRAERPLELEARRVIEANGCLKAPGTPTARCSALIAAEADALGVTERSVESFRVAVRPAAALAVTAQQETQNVRELLEQKTLQPKTLPSVSSLPPILNDSLAAEIQQHKHNANTCKSADWYVDTAGKVHLNGQGNKICVDVGNHSLSGPLQVRIEHNGDRPTHEVWPGETFSWPTDTWPQFNEEKPGTRIASLRVSGTPGGLVLSRIAARELNADSSKTFVLAIQLEELRKKVEDLTARQRSSKALKEELSGLRQALATAAPGDVLADDYQRGLRTMLDKLATLMRALSPSQDEINAAEPASSRSGDLPGRSRTAGVLRAPSASPRTANRSRPSQLSSGTGYRTRPLAPGRRPSRSMRSACGACMIFPRGCSTRSTRTPSMRRRPSHHPNRRGRHTSYCSRSFASRVNTTCCSRPKTSCLTRMHP